MNNAKALRTEGESSKCHTISILVEDKFGAFNRIAGMFAAKGSLYYTRPSIAHYMATRAQLEAGAADLFAAIASGAVKPGNVARYALEDAAQAHRDLEARRTTGSLTLIP